MPPIGSAADAAERLWEDAAASEVIRSEPLRALGRENRADVACYAASFARR